MSYTDMENEMLEVYANARLEAWAELSQLCSYLNLATNQRTKRLKQLKNTTKTYSLSVTKKYEAWL